MRLQKYLARAGVASRRASEALITDGRVSVNGVCVTELGVKVDPALDRVTVDGVAVELPAENVTIMLHKPAGYTTTMSDPHAAHTVAELVPVDEYPGLFPVGRLDTDTTGLLLFSTDGDLGNALLHPRKHVLKEYVALVEGELSEADVRRLRAGVKLDDGMTSPAEVRIARGKEAARAAELIGSDAQASGMRKRGEGERAGGRAGGNVDAPMGGKPGKAASYVIVGLREGRKRQVRRMLEAVGHPVIALHRESFGPLELGDLPRGSWRVLSDGEVQMLSAAVDAAGASS